MINQGATNRLLNLPRLKPEFVAVTGVLAAVGAAYSLLTFDPDDYIQPQQDDLVIIDSNQAKPLARYADPLSQLIAANVYGRRFVAPDETNYTAVGKVEFANGGHCSGLISFFDGYATSEPGMLVTLAGHCGINQDTKDISFSTTFTDATGALTTFTTSIEPEIWINPSYAADPYTEDGKLRVSTDDNALLFFPGQMIPDEITPTPQYIFSYHMDEFNDYKIGTALELRSVGYAADLDGERSVDEDCRADNFEQGYDLTTNCINNRGGSGGPLLASTAFNPNISLAVLSGVTAVNGYANIDDESFRSYFAPYFHHQLQDIDFLKRIPVCANLTGDYVNLREHATTDAETVGQPLRQNPQDIFKVVSMLENEQIELDAHNVWIEVTETPNGDSGYIRADLLKKAPCPT